MAVFIVLWSCLFPLNSDPWSATTLVTLLYKRMLKKGWQINHQFSPKEAKCISPTQIVWENWIFWSRPEDKISLVWSFSPKKGWKINHQFCAKEVKSAMHFFQTNREKVVSENRCFFCPDHKIGIMVRFIYILDSSNSSSFTFWMSQFTSSSRCNWTSISTGNSNGSWTDKHSSHFSTAR